MHIANATTLQLEVFKQEWLFPCYQIFHVLNHANRVPLNAQISQKLTVSDADGDKVRCRWGTAAEVGGVSQALPGATLDPVRKLILL